MSWPPTAPGTEAKPAPGFVASTAEVVAAEIRPIMQPAEAARMASAALRMDFLPEGGGTLAQTRWAFDGQPPTRPASLRSLSSGRASRGPGGSYAGRPPHKGYDIHTSRISDTQKKPRLLRGHKPKPSSQCLGDRFVMCLIKIRIS